MPSSSIANPIMIIFLLVVLSVIIFAIGMALRSAHKIRGRTAGVILAILVVVPLVGGAFFFAGYQYHHLHLTPAAKEVGGSS